VYVEGDEEAIKGGGMFDFISKIFRRETPTTSNDENASGKIIVEINNMTESKKKRLTRTIALNV
jgi:hypothetical protein